MSTTSRNSALRTTRQEIGEKIRRGRRLSGLSQEALGAALGLSFQQVQKYENGKNRVSVCTLIAIAAALDMDVGFFLPRNVAPISTHDIEAARRQVTCAKAMVGEAIANLTALRERLVETADRLTSHPPKLVEEAA